MKVCGDRFMRLLLVDYLGNSSKDGKPIGHSIKVLKEYVELLINDFTIGIAAPKNVINETKEMDVEKIILPLYICIDENDNLKKADVVKENLDTVLKIKGYDIIWFYAIDNSLYSWIIMHPSLYKRSICTVYQEKFSSRKTTILYWILKKKIGLIVSTCAQTGNQRALILPDYYYKDEIYNRKKMSKKNYVICVGTIGPEKQLEKIIPLFNSNHYQLKIVGHFRDSIRFENLNRNSNNNILIEDTYLSEDEYICTLKEARFAILPYDIKSYKNRTSGVLQECVFLNTIPIAPKALLEYNRIPGIFLEELYEGRINLDEIDCLSYYKKYDKLVETVFNKEIIHHSLVNRISAISNIKKSNTGE